MPQRQDTTACDHLRSLISPSAVGIDAVKHEPDMQASVRERYAAAVSRPAKRRKTSPAVCQACHKPSGRAWACLTCDYIGCMLEANCMRSHWQKRSCSFAVDPRSGGIFCRQCDDVGYSDTLDEAHRQLLLQAAERADRSVEQTSSGVKRRAAYRPWSGIVEAPVVPCRGLRPLLNLSQTCFLSAILQTFIHNPLLRSYFMSEKHNRHICSSSRGLAIGKPQMGDDREKGCMCCEIDRAFEEFHADDASPYAPITMLYAMWQVGGDLEGYGQQDAHSFFLIALEQIHAHAKGQLSSCNCIAHQTFAGSLLSAVTCSTCKRTSSTVDPILDIQLDFPAESARPLTLSRMLKKFCADERIEKSEGYDCAECGAGQAAVRKLVLKTLPPVLSFQLKRFKQIQAGASTKIETSVTFPSHLNMRPYAKPSTLPDELYQYDLFAVVTHEGKLENGHYWTDVLCESEWWHCDDDKVTPITLKDVLGQRAYMLFYVKRTLAYASVKKPAPLPSASAQDSGVGGKGVASKGMGLGGKSSHPIKGMQV